MGPGLVATSVFAFITTWNEYIFARVLLNDQSKQTVTVWLSYITGTSRHTDWGALMAASTDRKSTRLNSSHPSSSYAVFCLNKKNRLDIASTDDSSARIFDLKFANEKMDPRIEQSTQSEIPDLPQQTPATTPCRQSAPSRHN